MLRGHGDAVCSQNVAALHGRVRQADGCGCVGLKPLGNAGVIVADIQGAEHVT